MKSFDMNEFIEKDPELDVQKAVVESLAADKAEMDQKMDDLKAEAERLKAEAERLKEELARAKESLARAEADLAARMAKEIDLQERNPNALALLDREIEVPDRFPGETRDHVLEALAEARAKAEAEGRVRRAQVLEGVLMANEPNGSLAKRRGQLEKLFAANNNLVTGPVLEELRRQNISAKNGEEYLLPSEIIKRNF